MKQSLAYNFIINMWKEKRVDEQFVKSQSPKLITTDEVTVILNTPQN